MMMKMTMIFDISMKYSVITGFWGLRYSIRKYVTTFNLSWNYLRKKVN